MRRSEDIDLLDVGVWVALSTTEHPMRRAAAAYWQAESAPTLAFSRVTMLGLVRLLTNRTFAGGAPLSLDESWHTYATWRSQAEVVLAPEPSDCERVLKTWLDGRIVGPATFHDAYIAAFAVSGGYRLVTFDRDFSRFPDLDCLLLSA
jgi:toxin-antitoxin system PIN domain toxin